MASRFTYSRWDGSQTGFEFDPENLFGELTDELLYHGDVNAALRRMMQQGLRDRNGERLQGLRELMNRVREERQRRLERHDLGGVYDEINRELDDIVDEERHAVDAAEQAGERSGDERRAASAREAAADRQDAPRSAARRPRRQDARARLLPVRVERGSAPVRAAQGPSSRAADAAGRRPDDRGDGGHDARPTWSG